MTHNTPKEKGCLCDGNHEVTQYLCPTHGTPSYVPPQEEKPVQVGTQVRVQVAKGKPEWDIKKALDMVWQASPHNKERLIDPFIEKYQSVVASERKQAMKEVLEKVIASIPEEATEADGWEMVPEKCCPGDDTAEGYNFCRKNFIDQIDVVADSLGITLE
jgi:hypothetical protein